VTPFLDQRRIRPAKRGGGFEVRLEPAERELLASLPSQLVELLDATAGDDAAVAADPALARLFPRAYRDDCDNEANTDYHRLMGEDLRERHRSSLETLAAGAALDRIEIEDLHAWAAALTQLRLVLGARVGITDELDWDDIDDSHPAANAFALYGWLSWLQEQVVESLTTTLPDPL